MSNLLELAAVVDERLRELEAIDLREDSGGGYLGCGMPEGKPWFPKLHISNSQDKSLMKLPREGTGVVRYCVKNRNIDESREDGTPRYGATVEIQSIEPMDAAQDLAARIEGRLVEFGSGGRASLGRKLQVELVKAGAGKGKAVTAEVLKHPNFPNVEAMARRLGKRKVESVRRHVASRSRGFESATGDRRYEFSSARDRDDAGRFSPGSAAPKPEDYAQAHGAAPMTININNGKEKRKGRLRTGVALGVAGTLGYQNRGKIAGMMRR